jgi:hypothetical protein
MATNDKIYIQRCEFSIIEVKDQSRTGAIMAIQEFDWENEFKMQKQLESQGKHPRAACLCLGNFGDDYYVEISPKSKVAATIYYVQSKTVRNAKESKELSSIIKFSMFSPAKKIIAKALANNSLIAEEIVKENFPLEQIDTVISAYFDKNEQCLIGLLQ